MMQTYSLSVGVELSPTVDALAVSYPLVFGDPQIELLCHESATMDDSEDTAAALEAALPGWAWLSWRSDSPINSYAVLSIAHPHTLDELLDWLGAEPL